MAVNELELQSDLAGVSTLGKYVLSRSVNGGNVLGCVAYKNKYPHCSIFLYLARVITHVIKQLLSNALLCMHVTIAHAAVDSNSDYG